MQTRVAEAQDEAVVPSESLAREQAHSEPAGGAQTRARRLVAELAEPLPGSAQARLWRSGGAARPQGLGCCSGLGLPELRTIAPKII